jgi:dTDP-4-dehydrorhamnose 3,5-epimerase
MRDRADRAPGVLIVEPDVHYDGRGFFLETYHAETIPRRGIVGHSSRTTIRDRVGDGARSAPAGGQPQRSCVRVVEGRSVDVAVDVRVARRRSESGWA